MRTKFIKNLSIITITGLLVVAITLIANFKYYNWALWIVPLFFAALTYIIIAYLEPKTNSQFFSTNFTQATIFKLIMLIIFINLFRLFLDKSDWINFIAYSLINYIAYTALEVRYLLKVLNTND